MVVNFFSPDLSYYPPTKNFPFPDSFRFASLERIFTNKDKEPVISDSAIIYYDNYTANGQKKCCIQDTLEMFTDTINGKKYLFAIGDYIAVFQSDSTTSGDLRPRKTSVADQLLDIKLNTPYPVEKFKEEHESLGAKRVKLRESLNEVYKQKWAENDSILVETIQLNNSTDRMITTIYKEMTEAEANSAIAHIRNKFPGIKYQESTGADETGQAVRSIKMDQNGVSISFTQAGPSQYSFTISDYYETLRLIIKNAGTGYVFRDDVRIF